MHILHPALPAFEHFQEVMTTMRMLPLSLMSTCVHSEGNEVMRITQAWGIQAQSSSCAQHAQQVQAPNLQPSSM